jgi:hypothetical protein
VCGAALALGGATVVSAIGLASLSAVPSSAATVNDGFDCSTQVTATNNLCVDGGSNATTTAGGVLTVNDGSIGTLTLHGVYNDFLGSLDTSTGTVSFPADQTAWVRGLSGALSGIAATITITNDGTATGSYDPATGAVSESGNLTVSLSSVAGPCSYTQPFSASGTLSTPTAVSSTVSKATGTVTQASTPITINNGSASGSGCAIAESVLGSATQTLTLPVTAFAYSAPSVTTPGAPTDVTATPESGSTVALAWTAPSSDGGAAITGYTVNVTPSCSSCTGLTTTGTSTTVSGLSPKTTYSFTVSATNSAGAGPASSPATSATTLPIGAIGGVVLALMAGGGLFVYQRRRTSVRTRAQD